MKQINDPVLGELTYNENEGYWTKKIFLEIFDGDDYQLDLLIKCGKDEEIADSQREAYKSYLENLKQIEELTYPALLSFYKDHYEDINRQYDVDNDDELNMDSVNESILISYFDLKSLFIDRKGNYGWLVELIWDNYPLAVILSDDKIRIYEGWAVLVMNYNRVDDEAFGDMVYDRSWKKWVKMDINGEKGTWIPVVASAFPGKDITPEQRNNYLRYLENEERFFDEMPNALMKYYLENYEDIEEWWEDMPTKCNEQNVTKDSLMELISFHRLFFNEDGMRYGWLCGCPWDTTHGLSFYYKGESDEMHVGWKDSLFD